MFNRQSPLRALSVGPSAGGTNQVHSAYLAILIGHLLLGTTLTATVASPSRPELARAGRELPLLDETTNSSRSGHNFYESHSTPPKPNDFGSPESGGGHQSSANHHFEGDDDDELEVNRLAESRGFSIESHRVATEDGYILTIHRLVNPLVARASLQGAPVIVQHGILCASPFFLMNSSPQLDRPRAGQMETNSSGGTGIPVRHAQINNKEGQQQQRQRQREGQGQEPATSNSLAIELAQRGHDVWLPNFRGTQYSRAHLRGAELSESDYWDFNVDHLVEHDLAAYVRYVLDQTGRRRYMFVGHSLGATVGLGSLLVHHESRITRQLSCAILMAPVASTQFMRGRLMALFRLAALLYREPGPFPGPTQTFGSFVGHMCAHLRQLCLWLASMFVGAKRNGSSSFFSLPEVASLLRRSASMETGPGGNTSKQQQQQQQRQQQSEEEGQEEEEEFQNQVNTFLMMMRQSVSVQMLKHIVQVHSSGRLSRFNYGPSANKRRYGNTLAPIYDLSKINKPQLRLAIVSGQSDAISTEGEVGWISEQVRDKVGHFEQITVPVSPFNHMDLIMSSEAGKFVNKRLLRFIQQNKCLAVAG